jgi:hypothetical protein
MPKIAGQDQFTIQEVLLADQKRLETIDVFALSGIDIEPEVGERNILRKTRKTKGVLGRA